jgi:carbamate kinase
MSHEEVIRRMAAAGSTFAIEILRRKEQRDKQVKKVNIETVKEQIKVRSDDDIIRDPTTPVEEFFAAAERLERNK